jgi:hypothetical protein
MSSSLGLAGDLDDVDMLEDVEAAFDFRVSDEALARCWTVGDLFELIDARLPSECSAASCATAMCFYRLRRAIQPRLAIGLRPSTPIEELRRLSVREMHRIIKEECGLRPPPPTLSLWGCIALVLVPALPLGTLALELGSWAAAASAIVPVAGYRLAPFRHPKSVRTFGDLVRQVSSRSIGALSKQGARLRTPEAWAAFRDILSDHTALPKDMIPPETLIVAPKKAAS